MNHVDRIGVLSGGTLSVKVDPSVVGAEPDDGEDFGRGFDTTVDHSFKSVGGRNSSEQITVALEAGLTRLRVDGEDVVFDGFRYFPTDYEGERRHVEDATVDFVPADGTMYWPDSMSDYHAARDSTIADLIDGLHSGKFEPLPKAE